MNEVRVEVHFFVYRYLTFPLSNALTTSYKLVYYVLPFSLKYFLVSLVVFGYGLFRSILLTNIWWCFRYIVTDF